MSTDFIKKNTVTRVRIKERDTASDTNYLVLGAYRLFKKETKRKDITYKQFCAIPKMIHLKSMERLLKGRYALRLSNLGTVKVVKTLHAIKEANRTIINWPLYHKTGIRVPYRNSHTDGAVYKYHLYPFSKKLVQFGFYDLKMSNNHKASLGKAIMENKINIKSHE